MPNLFDFYSTSFSIQKKFIFKIYPGIYKTKITMKCAPGLVNTRELPNTYKLLGTILPTVFKSKCFNDQNNPFSIEVRKTEMAHLFEHVMLEYLCQFKLAQGENKVSVSGVTVWDWRKDPVGTFHITLNVGRESINAFHPAFLKSAELLEMLIENKVQ